MIELVKKLGFYERGYKFYEKEAPPHLGYFTYVTVDLRWEDIRISGRRGIEEETLFVGTVKTSEELHTLLKQTKAI